MSINQLCVNLNEWKPASTAAAAAAAAAAANQLQCKDTIYNGHFPHKLGLACSMSVFFLNMFQKRNAQASKLYIPSVPNVLHVGANEQCQSTERNTQH